MRRKTLISVITAILALVFVLPRGAIAFAQAPTLPTPEPALPDPAVLPPAPWRDSESPWAARAPADDVKLLEVRVADDTFVASKYPFDWRSFAGEQTVWFGVDSDLGILRTYLRWDLPTVPGQYVGAAVYLPIVGQEPEAELLTTVELPIQGWAGTTLKWQTQPSVNPSGIPNMTIGAQLGWYRIDVSNLVAKWYSGAVQNHGLMLRADYLPGQHIKGMWSREADNNKPVATLVIAYREDATPPACSMAPLPPVSPSPVPVRWYCEDEQTGVTQVELQMREPGAAWQTLQTFTESVQALDVPDRLGGRTYEFRVRATDGMTNVSDWTPEGLAITTIEQVAPQVRAVGPLSWLKLSAAANALENIRFVASDPGPVSSGVRRLEREVAAATSGVWQPVAQWNDMALSVGQRYFFRVRATDNAGNLGSWATLGPATVYLRSASGRVSDARDDLLVGLPLTSIPPALNSLTTDADARYTAYLDSSQPYTLNVALAGYQIVTGAEIPAGAEDVTALAHLVGATSNNVVNGDFAAPLAGAWQTSGQGAVRRSQAFLDTNLSLGFGVHPDEIISPDRGHPPAMAMGPDGTLHLIWVTQDAPGDALGTLHYASRRADAQQWSAPISLGRAYAMSVDPTQPVLVLAAGADGSLAAVYAASGDGIFGAWSFRLRPAGHDWGPPESAPSGWVTALVLDRSGTAHILYQQLKYPAELYYTARRAAGLWETPALVFQAEEYSAFLSPNALWVTPDGTRHIMYPYEHGTPNDVAYTSSTNGRTWSAKHILTQGIRQGAWPVGFQAAPDGSLYAFWSDNLDNQYDEAWYARLAGGVWSSPYRLSDSATWFVPSLDPRGIWHVLQGSRWYSPDILYRGANLQALTPVLNLPHSIAGASMVSSGDTVYTLRYQDTGWGFDPQDARLNSIPVTPTTEAVRVSQRMIVPDLAFPTLNWRGASGRLSNAGTGATLVIGLTDRQRVWHRVSDISGISDPGRSWSDMSPWRGQPITLTLDFDPQGDTSAWAWIDDIGLSGVPLNLGVSLSHTNQPRAGTPLNVLVGVANRRSLPSTVPVTVTWPAAWPLSSASVPPSMALPGTAQFEVSLDAFSTVSIALDLAIPSDEPRGVHAISARLATAVPEDYTPADNQAALTVIVEGLSTWLPLMLR